MSHSSGSFPSHNQIKYKSWWVKPYTNLKRINILKLITILKSEKTCFIIMIWPATYIYKNTQSSAIKRGNSEADRLDILDEHRATYLYGVEYIWGCCCILWNRRRRNSRAASPGSDSGSNFAPVGRENNLKIFPNILMRQQEIQKICCTGLARIC